MKSTLGSSAIFYLLVAVAFVILFVAAPYPHYDTQTGAWYLGESVGRRILGNEDARGVPLDKVILRVANSSVSSPLSLNCTTDADCSQYAAPNQCAVYCGNLDEQNLASIAQLNRQRVCDPSGWAKPTLDCKCISAKCISLK